MLLYKTQVFLYFLVIFSINCVIVNSNQEPIPELGQDDEFFTSASDMHLLLRVERKLGEELLGFMEREREKLESLERQIKEIERHHKTLEEGKTTEDWISNPLNAYGIMHRLLNFWPNFRDYAVNEKSRIARENLALDLQSLEGTYPSVTDLRGALAAIVRIQECYNITASEFIEKLGDHMHALTTLELFQMGYLWSELGDHSHAREWFMESVKRFPKKVKVVGFLEKTSLYEYLAWSEYKLFRLKDAIKHTRYVLKIKPNHKAAMTNLRLYQEYEEKLRKEPIDLSKPNMGEHSEFKKKTNYTWEVGKHNLLCSGKLPMKESIRKSLYCKYKSHKPRFLLKPLKLEIAYADPYIELYHDLLRDKEIKYIKKRAKPLLARATVHDPKTGKLTYANYRISKSAWLSPQKDPEVTRLYKHISLITGLDPRSYEPLQIANYGLAGQYEPHFDHATDKKPKRFAMYGGNRLATMLIYLSDVELGGYTVFTKTGPGVVIAPEKGMGMFWYNLKLSGKGNPKTEHAACPIILGEKWVSNIWIHEAHNEFSRKCSLKEDD